MTEVWRPIPDSQGYEVSNHGRVRSQRCVLTPFIVKSTGYMQVNIDGRRRRFVHRLVAAAFCTGVGDVVNHKNGVKSDNAATNLEWVTQKQNNIHAYRVLGVTPSCKGRFGGRHPTSKAVVARRLGSREEMVFLSGSDATRELGIASWAISHCCSGKKFSHKGYTFRLATSDDLEFYTMRRA